MTSRTRSDRRQNILQALAEQLESHPGSRITTAALARAVGVSEAALYRHFASKAKMFEALIDFAEDTIFGLITRILEQHPDADVRCDQIIRLLLGFAGRNPGITRVLLGDALVGENERLRVRVVKFFDRIETQLKQILREANLGNGPRASGSIDATANQFMTLIEGHMSRYVRTNFEKKPTAYIDEQWPVLRQGLFKL